MLVSLDFQTYREVVMEGKWLTTQETVKYIGRSQNALWLMVSRGFIEKRKWHGRLYFKKSELDKLIENGVFGEEY